MATSKKAPKKVPVVVGKATGKTSIPMKIK
jgi:hypothetical protein